jgi:hypothetical protein
MAPSLPKPLLVAKEGERAERLLAVSLEAGAFILEGQLVRAPQGRAASDPPAGGLAEDL